MRERAEAYAALLAKIDDIKAEMKAIEELAADSGMNVRAMKKVAKEINTDSDKLARKYEDEAQLDMFRAACEILKRKGLEPAMLDAAE